MEDQTQEIIRNAHCFIDAWGNSWMPEASRTINVPVFDILSSLPMLDIPISDCVAAKQHLPSGEHIFVGLNLSKLWICF
ncbi:MAG: hypothetical protein MRJ65_14485 [Candidatus Brocadiaceae bacterium]|nr:hypothetical protein [Candidatus Brocadiaceae bacterium]